MSTTPRPKPQPSPWQHRFRYFSISFFAIIMGFTGWSISWKVSALSISDHIAMVLGTISSVMMLVMTLLYCIKLRYFPEEVFAELRHPVKLNFFPAFSISLLLLSVIWNQYPSLSANLWVMGTVTQLGLTLYIVSSWINHSHYCLLHANPSWFIPVVGNMFVPISGNSLGYIELSWFFFSIGLLFWLSLLTIILHRLFFHESLSEQLMPMLFIFLTPPSIAFVAYTSLIDGLDTFARILFYVALFFGLLLFVNIYRLIHLPFFMSSWAYAFPLAAFTIASSKMAHLSHSQGLAALALGLLIALSLLLFALVLRTLKAIVNRELCQPEP
ncbi:MULTISPECIES: SLAC1 anion channel family protein [unclassified Agarivorans]|uniref:SLAC1 anion channel family protein n=1 Tax=unclassified Agarivorans TaxID=2636026 RepID=UPI003D7E2F75